MNYQSFENSEKFIHTKESSRANKPTEYEPIPEYVGASTYRESKAIGDVE